MRIIFLESNKRDLAWFRSYYENVFPEGHRRVGDRYRLTKRMLRNKPEAGRLVGQLGIRELLIARTPFSFIYRLNAGTIEILRVWDLRGDRPDNWGPD